MNDQEPTYTQRETNTCFPLLQHEKHNQEYESTGNRWRELWFFTLVRWEGGERKDREWKFCASSWGDLRAPPVVEVEGIETDNTSLAPPPLICCIFLFPLLYFYQIQKVDGRRYWEPFWWWYWREIVVVELCMITGGWVYFLKNFFKSYIKIILFYINNLKSFKNKNKLILKKLKFLKIQLKYNIKYHVVWFLKIIFVNILK